jgi:di/tripeptidase
MTWGMRSIDISDMDALNHQVNNYDEIIKDLISNQEFEQKIPEDAKKVACYKLKSQANSRFYQEVPLLDGVRPIDLLDMNDGLIVVKKYY